jgi:hypothetical protein
MAANPPPPRSVDPSALIGDAASAAQRALRNLGSQVRLPLDGVSSATESATNLVQRAATILEEELAAGIVAAQRVEGQFIDVKALHEPSDNGELLVRFRRDAHDVIDILVDLAASAADGLSGAARRAIRITASDEPRPSTSKAGAANRDVIASLTVPEPVNPGGTAAVSMSVENDGEQPTEDFALVFSGLVSDTGAQIAADRIEFTPKLLNLPAHGRERVEVQVHVPADATPGVYSGVVQATKLDHVRAVLVVTVN